MAVRLPGLSAFVVLACSAGCNSEQTPLAPVSGIVTFEGKPLVGAAIVFSPKSDDAYAGNSWGITDDSGRYTLKYGRSRVGACLGEHLVVIEHPTRTNRNLTATVAEPSNEIDFRLERPRPGELREPRDMRDTAIDAPITAK